MAAIDFPASPANGATFAPANGVTYRYVTPPGIWTVANGPVDTVIASDTPPAGAAPNQLWFNSALGQLFIYYNDGNTSQWVPANPQQLGPPAAQSIMLSHSPATISVGAGTSPFSWDTIDSNTTGGTYSTSSFTIPSGMGGVWDVQVSFLGSTAAASAFGTELLKNGSSILTAYNYAAPFASTVLLSGKCRLVVGDVLQANLYRGGTTTIYCNSAGGMRQSWMHLTRVGA